MVKNIYIFMAVLIGMKQMISPFVDYKHQDHGGSADGNRALCWDVNWNIQCRALNPTLSRMF